MAPVDFPESNRRFTAPSDLAESQVATIPAYAGHIEGGALDGVPIVVTAWKPDEGELALLNAGQPILLSFIGGLPPHMATMDFQSATHPA